MLEDLHLSFIEPSLYFIKDFISSIGYPGLAFLMAMDATIFPVPSAAVMGFAGYLCYEGRCSLTLVTVVGAIGSMFGSISMYSIARWGGRPFINRFGRCFGLSEKKVRSAEGWFQGHGTKAVLLCQLLPVFRDLIPFPAGMAKMNLARFAAFSFLGSIPFCFILALAGMISGPAWESTIALMDEYDIWLIFAGIILVVAYIIFTRKRSQPRASS